MSLAAFNTHENIKNLQGLQKKTGVMNWVNI